ncbi:MAG: glycosyltransferase family 4 protein [Patescibacteria group bacterium]
MKLLIYTQKVDSNDPILGFFHRWIEVFSHKYEHITVVCLYKGSVNLPSNVTVVSLGKEIGPSRFKYIRNFYIYLFKFRKNYDAVFVHMNQEYILMGGLLWKLFGKKIYMWRNHHAGSMLTDIAAAFCTNVFCTSKFSYTAKYKKVKFMPVGIDVDIFKRDSNIQKEKTLLFLARIAPAKKPHILLEAVKQLKDRNISATVSFYGDPLVKDKEYYTSLVEKTDAYNLKHNVSFHKGIPNTDTVPVYNKHEIFVNLSSSGMYDKTIFEAMACESLSIASNDNLKGEVDDSFIFREGDSTDLARKLEWLINLSNDQKAQYGTVLRNYVCDNHSLTKLSEKLYASI